MRWGLAEPTCADCGQRPPNKARGLCWRCYGQHHRAGTLDQYPVIGKPGIPVIDGISYRQLDHWTREGYLRPNNPAPGSGGHREWPEEELRIASLMGRLCKAGLSPAAAERVARDGSEIAPGIRVVIDA